MIEAEGNLFTYPADFYCIPINGVVDYHGRLVMGAGVAKQAAALNPTLPLKFGLTVRRRGLVAQPTIESSFITHPLTGHNMEFLLFPTKYHWKDYSANLGLIKESAHWIAHWAVSGLGHYAPITIAMPRPGCGHGNLNWGMVRPEIEGILPDNVVVVHNGQ